MARRRRWYPVVLGVALGLEGAAGAAAFTVNSTADVGDADPGDGKCQTSSPGICTLRAAIQEANTTSGATVLLPAGTFSLTAGQLVISHAMTITGQGAAETIVTANNVSRVLNVYPGIYETVHLTGVTLRDGMTGGSDAGGCVAIVGNLVADATVVTHCQVPAGVFGGAVDVFLGSLRMTRTSISDGHSAGGGAVAVHESSGAVIRDSTLSGNTATYGGGAVLVLGGDARLVNTTVEGNYSGDYGGGVAVTYATGTLALHNATVTNNTAGGHGGGVANTESSASQLTLLDSIVALNGHESGAFYVDDDCKGPLISSVANIVLTVDTSQCTISGSYSNASPSVGPLQRNGGLTKTRALLSGSAAIEAGNPAGCTDEAGAPLTADQRGVKRPIGAACDLGAYERSPCGDANGDGAVNVSDVFYVINTLFAGGAVPPGLADVNGDAALDVSDVFFLINALFAGGNQPSCPGT